MSTEMKIDSHKSMIISRRLWIDLSSLEQLEIFLCNFARNLLDGDAVYHENINTSCF